MFATACFPILSLLASPDCSNHLKQSSNRRPAAWKRGYVACSAFPTYGILGKIEGDPARHGLIISVSRQAFQYGWTLSFHGDRFDPEGDHRGQTDSLCPDDVYNLRDRKTCLRKTLLWSVKTRSGTRMPSWSKTLRVSRLASASHFVYVPAVGRCRGRICEHSCRKMKRRPKVRGLGVRQKYVVDWCSDIGAVLVLNYRLSTAEAKERPR